MDKKPPYEALERYIDHLERRNHEYEQTEAERKRQIELLNLTQHISNIGGWEWDIATQSMFWTEETYRIHGFNPQDLAPGSNDHILTSLSCYDEKDRKTLSDAFQRCVDDGVAYDMELPFTKKSGKKIWVRTSARAIKRDEKVIRVLGNIADITIRKQTELLLLKREKDLRESQRIARLGSWHLDIKTNEVIWSEELYHMYGFDPSLPPPPYTEHMKLFTPESWQQLSTSLNRTRKTGIPYVLELKTIKSDGTNGWMWVRGEAVKDSKGEIIGLWGAAQDITKRKLSELILKESEERYRNIFNTITDSLFIISLDGSKIIEANPAACWMYGYTPDEFNNLQTHDLITEDYHPVFESFVDTLQKTGTFFGETIDVRKDGSTFDTSVKGTVIHYKGEKCLIALIRDVTKLKQNEREKVKLINELEKTLAEIKRLKGILPLCSFCKKIRDNVGNWEPVDIYIHKHSSADISHSICPECMKKHYPEEYASIYSDPDN